MIRISTQTFMVTRDEWGALLPRYTIAVTPSFGTTVHWEGPHMGAFTHEACPSYVRGIQRYHMVAKGWSDIAYTAVVCPHGFVFQGRGLNRKTGANGTNDGNSKAYAVCYLGGEGDPFTDEGKRAISDYLGYLRSQGAAGSGVNCHRDWKATACPGDEICGWVKAGLSVTSPRLPPVTEKHPTLRWGSRGDVVFTWQKFMKVKADGIFGNKTLEATKKFQRDTGLMADGIVGPKTWKKLQDILDYLAAVGDKPEPPKPAKPAYPGQLIRRGSKGAHVRTVQTRLIYYGATIRVDGDFGPRTEEAVRQFQRNKRLAADGVVGPRTWEALWR